MQHPTIAKISAVLSDLNRDELEALALASATSFMAFGKLCDRTSSYCDIDNDDLRQRIHAMSTDQLAELLAPIAMVEQRERAQEYYTIPKQDDRFTRIMLLGIMGLLVMGFIYLALFPN